MKNESYYKAELESLIHDWIERETLEDNEFGFIGDDIEIRMAEAAFAVLAYGRSVSDYLEKEQLPNKD